MYLKVIGCEIAARELYYCAARSTNLVDIELLTQGHHDTPVRGREDLQARINAVPPGKYEAILIGYGLCSNLLAGLTTGHTRLVIPRAHDCITLFLGAKERYTECFAARPGTYYYTSGWLECPKRRGTTVSMWTGTDAPATANLSLQAAYEKWVSKYGEEQARYLLEEMGRWTAAYTHGTLIEFDFLRHLDLAKQVRQICEEKRWNFERLEGDLRLFQNLLDGQWPENDFLSVAPGEKVVATFDNRIIGVESVSAG